MNRITDKFGSGNSLKIMNRITESYLEYLTEKFADINYRDIIEFLDGNGINNERNGDVINELLELRLEVRIKE